MTLLQELIEDDGEEFTPEDRASHMIGDRMDRYDESKGDDQKWVTLTKIIVPTERDKEQLLAAIEYLHYCDIDTDFLGVNYLVHLYTNPDLIEVQA